MSDDDWREAKRQKEEEAYEREQARKQAEDDADARYYRRSTDSPDSYDSAWAERDSYNRSWEEKRRRDEEFEAELSRREAEFRTDSSTRSSPWFGAYSIVERELEPSEPKRLTHGANIAELRQLAFLANKYINTLIHQIGTEPQSTFVMAELIAWRLKDAGVKPEAFPELQDKEYVYGTLDNISTLQKMSASKLPAPQRSDAQKCREYILEMPLLDHAIKHIEYLKDYEVRQPILDQQIKLSQRLRLCGLATIPAGIIISFLLPESLRLAIAIIVFIITPALLVAGERLSHQPIKESNELKLKIPTANQLSQYTRRFGTTDTDYRALRTERVTFIKKIMGNTTLFPELFGKI